MEVLDYLRAAWRHWRLLLAMVLIGAALGVVATLLMTKQYEAEAQLFISTASTQDDANQMLQGSSFTQQRVKSYAEAISTPRVLQPVIDDLGLDITPSELGERMTSSVPLDTVLIDLTVRDTDPGRAARTANAITMEFAAVVPELENATAGNSPVTVSTLTSAEPPASPVSPRPALNVAAGTLLGLFLGLGLVLLRELTDTIVRDESDVSGVTDHVILGGVPLARGATPSPLIMRTDPHSPRAETYRTIRTNLQFVNVASQTTSMVFTSSVPNEGKTTTTANVAMALGESGATVCVVEADLRRPRLIEYLGLSEGAGLTNLIVGEVGFDDVLQPFGDTNISALAAGPIPPNPSELLGSPAMGEIVRKLAEEFDFVVYDAPPLLPVTDAAVLSKQTGGAVVVAGAGVVRKEQLRKTFELLENVDAPVLGVVVNRLPTKGPEANAYYEGGYAPDPVFNPDAPRSSTRRRRPSRSRRR